MTREELKQAAEKFAHQYDNGTCDGIAQECFIAGAEWMAEQGVTIKKTLRFSIAILAALLIFPVAMLMSYICDKVEPFVGLTISAILLVVCFTFLFYKLLNEIKKED